VRLHVCWGNYEGPHTHDVALDEILPHFYEARVGGLLVSMANPRHEHEWAIWEQVKLPRGKILIPGVISHTTVLIEHPELVAERLVRFANVVGAENVIAGADCGFATHPSEKPEILPQIVWAKFEALVEGARLASAASKR